MKFILNALLLCKNLLICLSGSFFGILFLQINIIYYFYLDNNCSNAFFILNFESIYQIFFYNKGNEY